MTGTMLTSTKSPRSKKANSIKFKTGKSKKMRMTRKKKARLSKFRHIKVKVKTREVKKARSRKKLNKRLTYSITLELVKVVRTLKRRTEKDLKPSRKRELKLKKKSLDVQSFVFLVM